MCPNTANYKILPKRFYPFPKARHKRRLLHQ